MIYAASIKNISIIRKQRKYEKKLLSIATVTMVAVAAAWSYSSNNNDVALADLALSNVEALASGEGGGSSCFYNDTQYWNYCSMYTSGIYCPCGW